MIPLYIVINSTFIAYMFRRVRVVGGRLQNRYCADFGEIAGILIVPVLGRHKVVSEPGSRFPSGPLCL